MRGRVEFLELENDWDRFCCSRRAREKPVAAMPTVLTAHSLIEVSLLQVRRQVPLAARGNDFRVTTPGEWTDFRRQIPRRVLATCSE
jgi:hypothetical protein